VAVAGRDLPDRLGEAGEEMFQQGQDQHDHAAGRPVPGGLRPRAPEGGGDALGEVGGGMRGEHRHAA
jgi:hypothetical protein